MRFAELMQIAPDLRQYRTEKMRNKGKCGKI